MSAYFYVSDQIFEVFPEYLRGVVVAQGIQNGLAPRELAEELRSAESELRGRLSLDTIASHPLIEPWREAYRAIGIKPSEFRPSVEALARRLLRGDPLPLINTIVDIGNLVSIRHLVPVGAHAIDVIRQDIGLRRASGAEIFEPFGSEAIEHPNPGEIVFVEGEMVLTRRWTWRQAKHTLVVPETRAVEFNIDGLPPAGREQVVQICQEVAGLIERYCQAPGTDLQISQDIVSREKTRVQLFA